MAAAAVSAADLATLVELMTELSVTRYSIGSCHLVEVTHIIRPDDFYVRPVSYHGYLSRLEAYEGPANEAKLSPGRIVVYKSEIEKRFVRGQIQSVRIDGDRKVCNLFALDYGFNENVYSNLLKRPRQDPLPALSLHCQLEMCQPRASKEFDQKATDAMKFYVGNEACKIVVKGQTASKLIVQLINSCPDDISTMLAYSQDTVLGNANNAINRFTCPKPPRAYFVFKQLKVGDTILVQVQSGDSLQNFYVADAEEYKDYMAESGDMARYLNFQSDLRPEDLKAGKTVAVLDGCNGYNRGVIKEVTVPGEKVKVQLVDSGLTVEVNALGTRVKALEREYFFLRPALAMYCSADDKQAWDNGLRRFLYPGYQFMITVQKVGKDLETPNIVTLTKIK